MQTDGVRSDVSNKNREGEETYIPKPLGLEPTGNTRRFLRGQEEKGNGGSAVPQYVFETGKSSA